MKRLRIGVSSCLLGDEVRFDGGHKRDALLIQALDPYVEWVRVCPEVELGLGVPREPVGLVSTGGDTRMVGVHTGIDHTDAMRAYAKRRVSELARADLSGYVLKAKSPSCGLHGVTVLMDAEAGSVSATGMGLFAAALREGLPDLPVEDELRLADAEVREAFLQRAMAYDRRERTLTPTRLVPVTRVAAGGATHATDVAAAEEPLDVRLHGRSFAVIMRTPGEDRALAAGFLLSERVIRSADDIGAIEHCRHPDQRKAHHVVDVYLCGDAAARVPAMLENRRQVIANSSCGVCGRATIDELRSGIAPLAAGWSVDVGMIRQLPDRLRARQAAFEETGGLHGAAVFAVDGTLLASAEDVGRHNAVDKSIGALLLREDTGVRSRFSIVENRDLTPVPSREDTLGVLMVSGRVSFEIVQKAWLAGIPVVAAISAPTSLAIELAEEAGVTLLGFVRERSLNIYAHGSRIAGV
jgi:FdhD protein